MDDSLIVSKSSLIEPENNNAFNQSKIETHMQRQEEKVDMREVVDVGSGPVNDEDHLLRMSRPRFASQVDEKNDLSKTVTPHYLPKVRESAAAKPHQVDTTGKMFTCLAHPKLSVTPNGSNDDITSHKNAIKLFILSLDKTVQASFFILMTLDHSSSSRGSIDSYDVCSTISSGPVSSSWIVIQEQEQASAPITSSKDKGKGIMVEEPLKMKKKDQVLFDEQEAIRLQAQFDEEERIAREKEESNAALIAQWNDIQEWRKHFAAKRAEERRNRPPIKAQQRSIMCTYLKNMAGWKPKDLKTNSFANVQELFEKAMKRVNTFVHMDTELVEGSETREEESSKRAGDELEQENSKKQKMEDDKETAELQSIMEVIPDEEKVAVDVIPLATKPPNIVDWKIIKEGKIGYYQIIRVDGNSKRYSSMIQMLKSFDREDLETLWKLVKAKHGYTRPEEGYKRVLWGDLKTLFEHNIEDTVFQDVHIFMLFEKRYPLTPATITEMLNRKLQADHCNEMCYQLLKLMTKQLKKHEGRIVGIKSLLEVTAVKVHGRDILCDIFGHNSLHEVYTSAYLRILHQHGVIGIDVASTGGNNSFGADLEFTREIGLEKDLIIEDFESFVGSIVEEDSYSVKNSLTLSAGRQSSPAGRQSGRRGESRAAESGASAGRHGTLLGGTTPAERQNGFPSGTLLMGNKGLTPFCRFFSYLRVAA
ncbi:hypothetical protein Tco_1145500 [Tanacetum coccineum]